jgi:hypothetical protein
MKWHIKLGFNVLLLAYISVLILFLKAFLSPAKAAIVYINNYGEMWFEAAFLLLSIPFVVIFIIELKKQNIIRFFPFLEKLWRNNGTRKSNSKGSKCE